MTRLTEEIMRECEQNPAIRRTADALGEALRPKTIYEVVATPEMKQALAGDLATLEKHPECVDSYFGVLAARLQTLGAAPQVFGWLRILESLHEADPDRYERIHKGSAFYWLAASAYFVRDYARAIVYMDAAFGEDFKNDPENCLTRPAGLFVTLRDDAEYQWAKQLVVEIVEVFNDAANRVESDGGLRLTVVEYRTRFVVPALMAQDGRRSIMTTLLSFLMEYEDRMFDLDILTTGTGSREPAFVHLFKGALVFESLLRMSPEGQVILGEKNGKATINDYLGDPRVWVKLGLKTAPQGFGPGSMDDVIRKVEADKGDQAKTYSERAIRAAWGVRNTTGHNLAWPTQLTSEQHSQLGALLFGAISLVILKLYP